MDAKEQRLQKIIEMYKDRVPESTIKQLAPLAEWYGGTVLSNLILDLYWSLMYGDEPTGPDGQKQN